MFKLMKFTFKMELSNLSFSTLIIKCIYARPSAEINQPGWILWWRNHLHPHPHPIYVPHADRIRIRSGRTSWFLWKPSYPSFRVEVPTQPYNPLDSWHKICIKGNGNLYKYWRAWLAGILDSGVQVCRVFYSNEKSRADPATHGRTSMEKSRRSWRTVSVCTKKE